MPVRARYKPNHKDMAKLLLSDQMREPCVQVARDIVAELKITVHRSTNKHGGSNGGHLADSYKVNDETAPVVLGGEPRVGAEVYSEHSGAAPDEFGGKNQKPKRWLGKVGAKWHVPMGGKG
jgi:hypothetical protein